MRRSTVLESKNLEFAFGIKSMQLMRYEPGPSETLKGVSPKVLSLLHRPFSTLFRGRLPAFTSRSLQSHRPSSLRIRLQEAAKLEGAPKSKARTPLPNWSLFL